MPASPLETIKLIQSTTVNHVTSSDTIMLVMMTNAIQLEEKISQIIKQIEVLVRTSSLVYMLAIFIFFYFMFGHINLFK